MILPMKLQHLINIIILVLCMQTQVIQSESEEHCNEEDAHLSCPNNEIILMTLAEYGRMGVGRCITSQEQLMECSNDVLPLLDKWCSGRQECEFEVADPELVQGNKECLAYLKLYLKTTFVCMKVERSCRQGQSTTLSNTKGILSSDVALSSGCGSPRSPWKVSVSPGQTVTMTMFDFSGYSQGQGHSFISCKVVYGYILERSLGINHTICGGAGRETELYRSKTNTVEIHLLSQSAAAAMHFLIQYAAIGCSDPSRPGNTWYRREGSEAVIGCETNDQEWRLSCEENRWQGLVGNCSVPVVIQKSPKETTEFHFSSLILVTGIVCGVVVAVVITVMMGVIYLKKYRMRQETKQIKTTYATIGRYQQGTYRAVTTNKPSTKPARNTALHQAWQMSQSGQSHDLMTSYPDPCSCQTLPPGGTVGGVKYSRDSAGYEAPNLMLSAS